MDDLAQVINDAAQHRRFLLDVMVRVADGRTSVPQGNCIASLSAEVHKSIRQAWDIAVYADQRLQVGEHGRLQLAAGAHPDV